MLEIIKNLFVGNEEHYFNLKKEHIPGREVDQPCDNFAVVHACKEPYHRQLLQYTGRGAPKDHPGYLFAERGNRLFMNIVDAPKSLFFDKTMIDKAIDFMEKKLDEGLKVLVHCNEGASRSPSISLLYLIKNGYIKGDTLEDCEVEFLKLYPNYNPGKGMRDFVKENFEFYKDLGKDIVHEVKKPKEVNKTKATKKVYTVEDKNVGE
ncbi:dual specificity protein phosphatase [Tissierella sp.]|uniref:dual specificity protein phosphatase family protein n=1 Tax=Tissierella sp. TaxID=41274 RepID=UPI0028547F2C|nr:dual specificity protein phosphatase [Tissierella sp.]MDR7856098.1 dual specificity protein phosphatase [Tissierella sp.]